MALVHEQKATSLPQYLEIVLGEAASWRNAFPDAEVWYRGHEKGTWLLEPTAYRGEWDEDSMFNRFRMEAPLLMEADVRPTELWPWYFAAQHYGLPTRLLDWSEDPLAGLFFALRGDRGDAEPAVLYEGGDLPVVWMLEPGSFNHCFHGRDMVYVPARDDLTCYWLPDKCERRKKTEFESASGRVDNKRPLAIHPARMTRRIQAQSGKFTVHGTADVPLERQWSASGQGRERHLLKVVVGEPDKMCAELFSLGYGRFRFFPEPASLSGHLRRIYRP